MPSTTRRNFLYLATGMAGVMGAGALAWPFIDQLRPDAGTLALSTVDVDISQIEEGMSITIKWRGMPVVIRNRTPAEVAEARQTSLKELKDDKARNANLNPNAPADDLSRSAGKGRENWLVMINLCTHLGCVTIGESGHYGGWYCPCHGSHYDTAGRVRSGPADQNLAIPPFFFLTDNMIRIGQENGQA